MKLTFLSKPLGTIALIAALSTVIGTVVQPTVQAQIDIEVPTDIDEEACVASGFYSFYLLQNIDLSTAELEELYRISSEEEDAFERLTDSYPKEKDYGGVQFASRPGVDIPSETMEFIYTALGETELTPDSAAETVAALNEEFGQYGEFGLGEIFTYTAAQKAELEQLEKDFEAQYIVVLTPEQQQQYQENLATQEKINEACGLVKDNSNRYVGSVGYQFEPTTF
jgi:hypothetical protein